MTQPWWRKKWFVIPAGILGGLIIIGAIVGTPPAKHAAKGISAPSASASSTSSSAAPATSRPPAPPPAKLTTVPVSVASPSRSASPAAPTSYTSAQAVAAACAADGRFVAKLNELTPRGDLITLEKYAGNILTPLLHVKGLSTAASNLHADANTLLAYVGSSSFPTQGTPVDPQITNVTNDYP